MLGTSPVAAEAVLRLSFDRLTKVSRRRIAAELEDLNSQLSFTMGEPSASSVDSLVLRPFAAEGPRHLRRAHRRRAVRRATARVRPPVISTTRFAPRVRRVARRGGGMAGGRRWIGEGRHGLRRACTAARSMFGSGFTPTYRKQGYGTAALRKSRSEMAAYFPAVPLVVRTPPPGRSVLEGGRRDRRTCGIHLALLAAKRGFRRRCASAQVGVSNS